MTDGMAGCMHCIKCGLLITRGTWRTDGSGPYCDDHACSTDHINMLQRQNQLMIEELCKIKNCQNAEYHFTLSESESVNLLKQELAKAKQEIDKLNYDMDSMLDTINEDAYDIAIAKKALRTRAKEYHDYLADCNDGCCDSTDMIFEMWLEAAAEELENE